MSACEISFNDRDYKQTQFYTKAFLCERLSMDFGRSDERKHRASYEQWLACLFFFFCSQCLVLFLFAFYFFSFSPFSERGTIPRSGLFPSKLPTNYGGPGPTPPARLACIGPSVSLPSGRQFIGAPPPLLSLKYQLLVVEIVSQSRSSFFFMADLSA